jgi:hypothetical protein
MSASGNKPKFRPCSPNDTLTSGVLKQDNSKRILSKFEHYTYDNITYQLAFATNTLEVDIPSDAALAFGEHLWTWPSALVKVLAVTIRYTGLAPTGLSATAGEVGMGTTIGSGANATMGAVAAAAENIMEGTTLENHVAATTLTQDLHNHPVAGFDHGAGTNTSGTNPGAGLLDAAAGTLKSHINVASTWNQTSAENIAFSVQGVCTYVLLGSDFGTE